MSEESVDSSNESSSGSSAHMIRVLQKEQREKSSYSSCESRTGRSKVAISKQRRARRQESGRHYRRKQSTSESETEEKDDDDERLCTEGSIHRLCINKLPLLFSPWKLEVTEEEIIQKLVNQFNSRKKTAASTADFKLEPNKTVSKNPGSVDKLCKQLPYNNFQNRLYVSQRHRRVPPILKYHGSNRKCGPIHLCWFFYRPGEIFAFTTNQGYRLVHDYSEFDFPNKIAGRLCTDEGFKVTKKRLLVGPDWEEAKTSKTSERPSMGDFPSLYSTFICELRPDASIRRVTKLSQSSKNMKFEACSVRFVSKLKIMDLPKILDHLSTIAKGLPTFAYMPPPNTSEEAEQGGAESTSPATEEEISNTVYNCYLVPVEKGIDFYDELDLQLAHKFRLAVVLGDWDEFSFDLGHKYHNDYALASKVELLRSVNHR